MSDLHVCGLGGPAEPSETQPSAWHAHRSIRKVILSLWGLVVVYAVLAAHATWIWCIIFRKRGSWEFWSFFHSASNMPWFMSLDGDAAIQWWILSFVIVVLAQGPLTLGLHCSELVVNVIRDEREWRHAAGRKGLKMATNPLRSFATDPLCLVLFVIKPVLHWMFGLSLVIYCEVDSEVIDLIVVVVYPAQVWHFCIALFIFACFCTLVAFHRPRGPQPAAYGHLQTLANLIDEWSPVMWWGHKEDGIPYCHAGTSNHPLPPVKMDCVYAGLASSVGSHPSVSAGKFMSGDALTVRTARRAVE
ncbi:hypothetical protein M405DRAFT_824944 [Rhizopogon salebrosus TDB-379]|nr:hypothetical protein M405DRAFT_824944 [Rhizopogon salebrosus TDB-379]